MNEVIKDMALAVLIVFVFACMGFAVAVNAGWIS
jgi:hypothetical protein